MRLSEEDRTVFIDQLGRLCVRYPRPTWTKKRAIDNFEIRPPWGSFRDRYQEGVAWEPCHTKDAWTWFQPKPECSVSG